MATPNPLEPVKGAGTTLWVYNGKGDAYANPLSDADWQRLAKVKDLTPGEMTAESYDDNYLDDEDADWTATGQGQKSAGDTSFTLAWKPGEEGQKGLIGWFESGDVRAYKIRFPNGTVDVFRGWVSSIGKAVTAKEVITRTVKVTNVGKPSVAEERSKITPVSAIKVTPTSGTVAKGKTTTLTVTVEPENATDKTFRAISADPSKATISVKDMTITVTGVHEQLGEGTVIHIVPRLAGAGKGGLQIVLGAAAIVGSFFTAGASMALWGSALAAGGFSATTMLFSLGASMILGGVAQMLAPKAKTPDYRATDNGRQNTYFSSLDNMIAQGNPMPVPYGEMLVGSRRISQDISTRDEGGGGKVVVIGRQG